jgi:hypothetical protein
VCKIPCVEERADTAARNGGAKTPATVVSAVRGGSVTSETPIPPVSRRASGTILLVGRGGGGGGGGADGNAGNGSGGGGGGRERVEREDTSQMVLPDADRGGVGGTQGVQYGQTVSDGGDEDDDDGVEDGEGEGAVERQVAQLLGVCVGALGCLLLDPAGRSRMPPPVVTAAAMGSRNTAVAWGRDDGATWGRDDGIVGHGHGHEGAAGGGGGDNATEDGIEAADVTGTAAAVTARAEAAAKKGRGAAKNGKGTIPTVRWARNGW